MLLHVRVRVQTHSVEGVRVAVVLLNHIVITREYLETLGDGILRSVGFAVLSEILNECLLNF
jgi:hypothetical protein